MFGMKHFGVEWNYVCSGRVVGQPKLFCWLGSSGCGLMEVSVGFESGWRMTSNVIFRIGSGTTRPATESRMDV